jgi:xanthine dehydrogenase accessory factor
VRYGVTTEQAHRFGLPCGGTLELMLEPLSAHSRLAETLAALEQRQTLQRTLDLRSGAVTLAPGAHDAAPHWADEHHFVSQLGRGAAAADRGGGSVALPGRHGARHGL